MDKNMKKLNILILSLIFFPTQSNAANDLFYVGLGYGISDYESTTKYDGNLSPNQKLNDEPDFAEIYFGYHINRVISLEIGYADFEKVNKTYTLSPAGMASYFASNNKEQIEVNRISFATLIEYPLFRDLSLFGLLGHSWFNLDRTISGPDGVDVGAYGPRYGLIESGSDSEKGIFYGLGAKYKFANKFTAKLQWVNFDINELDENGFRLSLEMNF